MIFSWLKRRRRRIWQAKPFPLEWEHYINENVNHYHHLSPAERSQLRSSVQVLVPEKNWEGCGGLEMTDEVRVTIAAQISLLTLGFKDEYFDRVLSILVYPTAYAAPEKVPTGGGMVLEVESHREGEAWYRGPVILSWSDVLSSGRGDEGGHFLVAHEFAHQLDMLNGAYTDGVPPLDNNRLAQRWETVMSSEFNRLRMECDQGFHTVLDCYGATNRAEFFAVATENFFQRPRLLSLRHPQIYSLLCEYYRQDPAVRYV